MAIFPTFLCAQRLEPENRVNADSYEIFVIEYDDLSWLISRETKASNTRQDAVLERPNDSAIASRELIVTEDWDN